MGKLAVWNLSHDVNYTELCRSLYNVFSLCPVVDVKYWRADPDTKTGTGVEIAQWKKIDSLILEESAKFIKPETPLKDKRNETMIALWADIYRLIELDYEAVRDAAKDAGRTQAAGNGPRIVSNA